METESQKVIVNRGMNLKIAKDTQKQSVENENIIQSEAEKEKPKEKEKLLVRLLDVFMSFSLIALFFGLPIFFTTLTYQGLAFEKTLYLYICILLMLITWATKGVLIGEMKIRRTPLDIPIVIALVVYIASAFFSVDRWHSFWGFFGDPSRGVIMAIALVIGYYAIASNFTEKKFWQSVYALIFSNFLLAIWMTLALLGVKLLPDSVAVRMPLNPFGSMSGLSIFLAMMIPIVMVAVFHLSESGKMKKVFSYIISLLVVADIFLLWLMHSFVPWIAVLIGVSFFLIYVLARLVTPAKGWTWLSGFVFVCILAIVLVGKASFVKIQLPIEATPNYSLSWQVIKDSVRENAILGSGPATFGYGFSKFKPQEFNLNPLYNLRFYQGTGLLLESIVTAGLLGGISFVLLILTFISVVLYLISRNKQINKITSLGVITSSLIFLISLLSAQIEASVLIIGVLISTLAVAIISKESNSQENSINLSLKASPKYALSLAFVFMIVSAGVVFMVVFFAKAFVADVYAGKAVKVEKIAEDGSIKEMSKAAGMFGYESRYYTRLAQDYMVLANNEFLKEENSRDAEALKRYLTNSISAAKIGVSKMPNDALAQEVLAQVYDNATFYIPQSATLAMEAYQRALELEPHNAQYLLKIGQIKEMDVSQKQGDEQKQLLNETKELFEKAIIEKKDYSPAHFQLALVREALGDLDGAIRDMSNAVLLDGTNVNSVYNLGRLYQRRGSEEDLNVARQVYDKILQANEKDINTRLSLGLLFEKQKKTNEAIEQYQVVLSNLPENTDDNVRQKLQKMISNAQSGIENTPQNLEVVSQ